MSKEVECGCRPASSLRWKSLNSWRSNRRPAPSRVDRQTARVCPTRRHPHRLCRYIRKSRRAIKPALLRAALGATLAAGTACAVPAAAADRADFKGEIASTSARAVADWIVASHDNHGLPFVIVDKIAARVFVFDPHGASSGAAPALLGIGIGDETVPGIGQRKLSAIGPTERTTPAGRFQASLGEDFEQDILWVDYDAALSLHRVIAGKPSDRRKARLTSPTPLDNRITFGCINVPAAFYDAVVAPAFKGTVGIVYILPETKPLETVFAIRPPLPSTP